MTTRSAKRGRSFGKAAGSLAAVLLAAACGEQRLGTGTQLDIVAPAVAVNKTAGDTMDVSQHLRFSVATSDNLGLKTITVQLTGGFTSQVDTTFATAVTAFTLPVDITFPPNSTAGGWVQIRAIATDGNNNSAVAVDSIFLTNIDALIVNLVRPAPGAVASPGREILIQVDARQRNGVKKIGWVALGAVTNSDSVLISPLDTSVTFVDTLLVPGTATSGTFTVSGFAEDSVGRRVFTSTTTVTIQSVANDTVPPVVTFSILPRVEVRDSITVRARDPSGIALIGWLATDLTGTVVGGDSLSSGGTLTDVIQTFNLNFGFTTFPQEVVIAAFAVDAANNRGEARTDSTATGPVLRDTVTVVNGITRPLPAGGRVVDAVYNRNLNEIYLTNVDLNRLEVFDVTDTTFAGFVFVGSRPWGVAMWPSDTLGNPLNQVIVANSGGTNLSIVDAIARRELRRHALPNIIVQTVQSVVDPNIPNNIELKVTEYDFTDRPAYLAATCRPTTGSQNCASDSIFAIYSTTATPGQPAGFSRRGTLRWEQVGTGAAQSHFFWEHAATAPSPDSDTLQVIVFRSPSLVTDTILGANCGVTVLTDRLAFFDTTFVRNSGNFTHALVGEGGAAGSLARAISYNGVRGLVRAACPPLTVQGVPFTGIIQTDIGISAAADVRDFIANTATPVKSIGINFNGLTNLIRADSVYVLNDALRLMGLLDVGGVNPGMDLNFDHAFDANTAGTPTFGGTLSPNDRLVFLAREDAGIDVFDTFFYGRVASIPLRDPVTGPLRVSKLPSGEQVLVGVTARGVVVARLPAIANIYQARIWGAPIP